MKPIVAVNFKAYYPHSFGEKALKLAESAKRVWEETSVKIILAPPYTEIRGIAKYLEGSEVEVYAQHADPIEPGAQTGFIPLEGIKDAGAVGVILNHSEHRLKLADIGWLIKRAKKLGLKTLVCADEPETTAAAAALNPDIVAVEPPELIGTGIPVSKAKPEVITSTVDLVRKISKELTILTGAGISAGEDVYIAIKLGTQGVLVASAIVKAKDPYQVMKDMALKALEAWEK